MSTKDDDRRRPYAGNRAQGPGRRTYPDAASGPRVGRIARDVPRAQRVDDFEAGESLPQSRPARGGDFHRGSAYRAPTGPRQYKRQMDGAPSPELPGDDHILAGRNPIRGR